MAAEIRIAAEGDLPAITDIYNREVTSSTATFDTEPRTLDRQKMWLDEHSDLHPVVVAIMGSEVTGWGSLSPWSDRLAYARTAEISLYVREGFRGKGIGGALVRDLLLRAERSGLHAILARISEESLASLELFRKSGFVQVGTMKEVGEKFGRLLSVHILQKTLDGSVAG